MGLNFNDLVGKDRAYGGCVHAVAEASKGFYLIIVVLLNRELGIF